MRIDNGELIIENPSVKKILTLVVILFVSVWWCIRSVGPVDRTDATPILVPIQSGDSVARIALKLSESELIHSQFFFKIVAKYSGKSGQLQAGTFALSKALSVSEILDVLHTGKSQEAKVTIPEGFTVADIDALMAKKGFGNPGDIIDCAFRCDFSSFEFLPPTSHGTREQGIGSKLEGYLFPETYALSTGEYNPKFFLERMLGEFRRRIVTAHADAIKKSGKTLANLVIMASLIEEESRHDEERAIVSGILWKRLENKVVLGVDATTRYGTRKKTEALRKSDLEADSPYNTRRKQGLPPTPIASPSESSFMASLEPTASQFWYYLHGTDGVIHYAVTDEEHIKNKYKYLR